MSPQPTVPLPAAESDHRARALAAEREHVRRYRRVQQFMRVAFAVAAVAAIALAWWLGQRLDFAPPAPTPTAQTVEFTNTPLADVLAQFNRQNRLQFTLADPALGTLPISGALNVSNPDGFIHLLAAAHGLRAEARGAYELVLHR